MVTLYTVRRLQPGRAGPRRDTSREPALSAIPPLPAWLRRLTAALLLFATLPPAAAQEPPIHLRIVGGLGGVSQYTRYEAPFWSQRLPQLTGGRLQAEITPFDRAGIRGAEMLQLIRLGVVPFGTVLLAVAAADEPEFGAVDLPVLNPDIASLRATVNRLRPRLAMLLRDRYGVELLGIYTYPAQVLFCRQPFSGLADLGGRRVRVSSVGQAELMEAVGATGVILPFSETVSAVRGGIVECAITGTLSGNAIGLQSVTNYLSRQAISWGVSIFGANQTAWATLPEELRAVLRDGLMALEDEIWGGADRETEQGLACNAGLPDCTDGVRGRMVVVEDRAADTAQRQQELLRRNQLLRDSVVPSWVQRCGAECADTWNGTLAPVHGFRVRAE